MADDGRAGGLRRDVAHEHPLADRWQRGRLADDGEPEAFSAHVDGLGREPRVQLEAESLAEIDAAAGQRT